VIGIAFGAGNGSTTFNLPDLRSRNIRGASTLSGAAVLGQSEAGLPTGSTGTPPAEDIGRTTRASHTHSHDVTLPNADLVLTIQSNTTTGGGANRVTGVTGLTAGNHAHAGGSADSASGIAAGTVHAYQALNYIIKI